MLKSAYDGLRVTSDELQAANLRIFELLTLRMMRQQGDARSSTCRDIEKHERAAFGNQDPWHLALQEDGCTHRLRTLLTSIDATPERLEHELKGATASKARLETAHGCDSGVH